MNVAPPTEGSLMEPTAPPRTPHHTPSANDAPWLTYPWEPDCEPLHVEMSRDEYDALELPDYLRAEWSKGLAIIMSGVRPPHGVANSRLIYVLNRDLDAHHGHRAPLVMTAVDTLMPDSTRIPDIMVVEPDTDLTQKISSPPLLVVEIMSPSTWHQDVFAKADEYAEFGIPHYWIVDTDKRAIFLRTNVGNAWETTAVVDQKNPTATVTLGDYGPVTLNLNDIIR